MEIIFGDNLMKCEIYKSKKKKADTYLYVNKPADFSLIPKPLNEALGELEFVMELELTKDKKLAREDVETIIRNLSDQGYHLQMPPLLTSLLNVHKKNR